MIPEHIERIEKELADVDAKIAELKLKKEAIIRNDPRYSDYLDCYNAIRFDNNPLTIRQYYQSLEEFEVINKAFITAFQEDDETTIKQLFGKLRLLENRLAA